MRALRAIVTCSVLLVLGVASAHAEEATPTSPTAEETACYNAVQCRLDNGKSKSWPEPMVRALCEKTNDWKAVEHCFLDYFLRTRNASQATAFCRMENGAGPQPAGEIRPIYIVNQTDKVQHFVVTGQVKSMSKKGNWVQTAIRDVVGPKSEKSVFMSLSSKSEYSSMYGTIWVTTDVAKAQRLEAAVVASRIALSALAAFLEGQDLSADNVPDGIPLDGQDTVFDDGIAIDVQGGNKKTVYVAMTGTNTAKLVEKGSLLRARNPASVHDLATEPPPALAQCAGEQPTYEERAFTKWFDAADARAHDKGCSPDVDGKHLYHVRCEATAYPRDAGRFGWECLYPNTQKFLGRQPMGTPVRLEDNTWEEMGLWDASCASAWATSLTRAHKKSCSGGAQIYHVRCEHPDGGQSGTCSEMPRAAFNGMAMLSAPKRLNKEWTEVAVEAAECKVAWATSLSRAHKKSCSGGSQIYHLRCERPDGSADTSCIDMARGSFNGMTMTAAPKRLNTEWTEVAVDDNTCKVNWATSLSRAQKKWCWQGAQVYHVRCERPDGSADTVCPDLPMGAFNGMNMKLPPKRLNPEWTEVFVESAACR